MKKITIALIMSVAFLISINAFADDYDDYEDIDYKIRIAYKDNIGEYLADAKGRTLYWFKKDSPYMSVCEDGCLDIWPVFYHENIEPPCNVDDDDFSYIIRSDGLKQSTFRGFPLYYFFKDKSSGDTFGQGVRNVWFVIDPARFQMN